MLLFVDGFSHYTDAFLGQKWDYRDAASEGVTQSQNTGGRFGGGCVEFAMLGGDGTQNLRKSFDGVGTIICGFAVQQTGVQHEDGGWLIQFLDGNTVNFGLKIQQSGQLLAFRNKTVGQGVASQSQSGWTSLVNQLGQSTNALSATSYDFIEMKLICDPTTGSIEIKRNGSAFWTLTNINTAMSGVNNVASLNLGGFEPGHTLSGRFRKSQFRLTDFYLLNTVASGSDALNPVDFIGDRHWEPITTTADGADTAWTITGSANHFANVDEVPPNTTDFNSTATLNARDGFVVSSPTGPSTASALIAFTMFLQKNTGGSNAVKGFMRSAGGVYKDGSEFQVPTPWAFRQSFLGTKPAGGAITVADINSHQLGYIKTI